MSFKAVSFTFFSLLLTLSQVHAKEVLCKSMNIHSEERKEKFIKITPTTPRTATFEVCKYKTNECRNLGLGHYKTQNMEKLSYFEQAKGAAILVAEVETAYVAGMVGGIAGLVVANSFRIGTLGHAAFVALGNTVVANTSWTLTTSGLMGLSTLLPKIINPLSKFHTVVAMREIDQELKNNSCVMFVEDNEEDLLYYMQDVVEALDYIPYNEDRIQEISEET